MRLRKIYSFGTVLNADLYTRLQDLDKRVFVGAKNEFKENREWWVIVEDNTIIAYCGSLYDDGVCLFVRAWVYAPFRGKGLQSKMINARLKAGRVLGCYKAITYVYVKGVVSMNNLIKNGFRIYIPQLNYAGSEFLYFYKDL